ncbi:hypothetical protein G6011_07006 [Alternaria panax]|uniref:RING-type domain-containing protein n=1 Tax=Alternaria panax TaxID=48097 RepID=A0AAD4FA48_9PLEO|nr:hypothetical protein G6011_07006 [Alternaria panax]
MAPLYNTRETFSDTALYPRTAQISKFIEDPLPLCSICTEPCTLVFTGSTHHALQMPSCSHIFGASCIETWFDRASTCPLCRKDFFPIEPEETSLELQELPDLFVRIFTLLGKVKKRYPQGRKMVVAIENRIADLREKVIKDVERRTKRKTERAEAGREAGVLLEQRQREIQDLIVWRQQWRQPVFEDRPETRQAPRQRRTPPPRTPQVLTTAPTSLTSPSQVAVPERITLGPNWVFFSSPALTSVWQDVTTFLAYDFGPHLAAPGGFERLLPGTIGHTRLQNAELLAERAESFGLTGAARDVRRKRATVINNLNITEFGQETETGRLGGHIERRRGGRLNGAALQRRRGWGWLRWN